jgi:hypothetical protein
MSRPEKLLATQRGGRVRIRSIILVEPSRSTGIDLPMVKGSLSNGGTVYFGPFDDEAARDAWLDRHFPLQGEWVEPEPAELEPEPEPARIVHRFSRVEARGTRGWVGHCSCGWSLEAADYEVTQDALVDHVHDGNHP